MYKFIFVEFGHQLPILVHFEVVAVKASEKKFITEEPSGTNNFADVDNLNFTLDLFYNLEQVVLAKKFYDKHELVTELFLDCDIESALPLLEELATKDDIRAWYILVLIYNEGINVEKNIDYAQELLGKNISAGDSCSIVYAQIRTPISPNKLVCQRVWQKPPQLSLRRRKQFCYQKFQWCIKFPERLFSERRSQSEL